MCLTQCGVRWRLVSSPSCLQWGLLFEKRPFEPWSSNLCSVQSASYPGPSFLRTDSLSAWHIGDIQKKLYVWEITLKICSSVSLRGLWRIIDSHEKDQDADSLEPTAQLSHAHTLCVAKWWWNVAVTTTQLSTERKLGLILEDQVDFLLSLLFPFHSNNCAITWMLFKN